MESKFLLRLTPYYSFYDSRIVRLNLISCPYIRSVIDTKESDGIDDPMEKIAIKSHSDHSDSGIGKMLILIDAYFVILMQYNKMTK